MKNYTNSIALLKSLNRIRKRFHSGIMRNVSNDSSRNEWKSVIGLEIHAQLSTKSKLFSSAPSCYGAPTNSIVALFDAAIPGTLPVLSKAAVELAVISSLALGCNVNPISYFDRKHYFYPDMPAGYQITQHRHPIAENGLVEYAVFQPGVHSKPYYKKSKIKQIQLEQDSGKTLHFEKERQSYIDLNRAGNALIEIVFEPDVDDEEEACALVKEVIKILKRVESCSCKLEEGALRVDVNISVSKNENLGVRTEIKNLGAIHGICNAIKYEKRRQISIIERGGVVKNETLTWDADNNEAIIMRDKEDSQDYRFMPEPNLPPLRLLLDDFSGKFHENVKNKNGIFDLRHLKKKIPSLPQQDRIFAMEKYGLSDMYAFNLVNQDKLFYYFKEIISENSSRKPNTIYCFLMYQFLKALNSKNIDLNKCSLPAWHLGQVVDLLQSRSISKMTSDYLLLEVLDESNSSTPLELFERNNLKIISNPKELRKFCLRVIEKESALLSAYKKKKKIVFNELVKKVIEESNHRADTQVLPSIMKDVLTEKFEKDG